MAMNFMLSSPTKIIAAICIAFLFCGAMNLEARTQEINSFKLVLQWPASYCSTRNSCCCHPLVANFSIHGLWPNSFCKSNTPFNSSQISDLRSKMDIEWPSLACPRCNNTWFWQYQWRRHGTCSESVFNNQHDYFAAALRLKESVDLLRALGEENIVPHKTRRYNLSDIQKVLNNVTGNHVGVECNKSNQLYQIHLCVDENALNFKNCSVWKNNQSSVAVEFPSESFKFKPVHN